VAWRDSWRWFAALGLGTAVFVWVLWRVDLAAIVSVLAMADGFQVWLVMPMLILAVWVLRAVRWMIVLVALGFAPRIIPTYLSVGAAIGLGSATPGQTGELLKLAYVQRSGRSDIARSVSGFVIERVADIFTLLVLTTTSSIVVLSDSRLLIPAIAIAIAMLACMVILPLILDRSGIPTVLRSLSKGVKAMVVKPLSGFMILLVTLLCWLVTTQLWHVALGAIGIEVPFAFCILLVGGVTIATVATLLPGGIGISELTVVVLLNRQGYGADDAFAAALVLRLITLQTMALGLAHWLVLKTGWFAR
jgi:uncharacterized membrane protein YbhN (UPF0104 family)